MEETTLEPINPLRYAVAPRRRELAYASAATSSKEDRFVDGLLISWHEWRRGYRLGKGYRSSDSTCQDYQTPGHYDWKNGASADRVENEIMRGVDRAVMRVCNEPQCWRTALEFEATLLATGRSGNAEGLPHDPAERDIVRLEARNKLMRELQKEGVMTA